MLREELFHSQRLNKGHMLLFKSWKSCWLEWVLAQMLKQWRDAHFGTTLLMEEVVILVYASLSAVTITDPSNFSVKVTYTNLIDFY